MTHLAEIRVPEPQNNSKNNGTNFFSVPRLVYIVSNTVCVDGWKIFNAFEDQLRANTLT